MEHGSIEGGTNTAHEKSETDVEKAADTPQKPDDSSADTNLVDWDGKDDPENPQNYSNRQTRMVSRFLATATGIWKIAKMR